MSSGAYGSSEEKVLGPGQCEEVSIYIQVARGSGQLKMATNLS